MCVPLHACSYASICVCSHLCVFVCRRIDGGIGIFACFRVFECVPRTYTACPFVHACMGGAGEGIEHRWVGGQVITSTKTLQQCTPVCIYRVCNVHYCAHYSHSAHYHAQGSVQASLFCELSMGIHKCACVCTSAHMYMYSHTGGASNVHGHTSPLSIDGTPLRPLLPPLFSPLLSPLLPIVVLPVSAVLLRAAAGARTAGHTHAGKVSSNTVCSISVCSIVASSMTVGGGCTLFMLSFDSCGIPWPPVSQPCAGDVCSGGRMQGRQEGMLIETNTRVLKHIWFLNAGFHTHV